MRKIDLNNFQVATSGTARDINRRIVLNLIRKHQPVSRADLSRHSGLQRSTVSAIAEELIADRWISESGVGNLPRGRKPTFLHLNEHRVGIIGVNVRPVQTMLALAGLDTNFLTKESMQTGRDPELFVEELIRRIHTLRASHPEIEYEGIGVALPGRVDLATHRLVFAPNLGWKPFDLKKPLEDGTGLPVELENAANACALAELWSGRHGDSVRNLVAVTISEGIGVGMILNGQLVTGASGLAGEFGHVTVDENGPGCACGNRGCWERCASNTAAIDFYNEARNGHGRKPGKNGASGLSFDHLLRLAEQGDQKAGAALERMARFLGNGLAMVVRALEPEVVVLVGEVTRAWSRVGPLVNMALEERIPHHRRVLLAPTDPDTEPRLRGTIALALQKHFGAPTVA